MPLYTPHKCKKCNNIITNSKLAYCSECQLHILHNLQREYSENKADTNKSLPKSTKHMTLHSKTCALCKKSFTTIHPTDVACPTCLMQLYEVIAKDKEDTINLLTVKQPSELTLKEEIIETGKILRAHLIKQHPEFFKEYIKNKTMQNNLNKQFKEYEQSIKADK